MSPSIDTRETRAFAFETKFLVSASLAERIREWARARLNPDPNAGGASGDEYRTTSLYFDTAEFDVFRKRDSYGRSKYRVRRYDDGGEVFLERKLRNSRLLSKRRTSIGIEELGRLNDRHVADGWAGLWFKRRLTGRRLNPMCQVSYRRMARVAMTPYGPIRLTLDSDVRASATDRLEFETAIGTPVLDTHQILELKYRVAMPVLFKSLVESYKLSPNAVSKYRLGVAATASLSY